MEFDAVTSPLWVLYLAQKRQLKKKKKKKDGFIASGLAESRPGFSDTATAGRLCGVLRGGSPVQAFLFIYLMEFCSGIYGKLLGGDIVDSQRQSWNL